MSLNAAIAILLVFSAIVGNSVKSFTASVTLNDATWSATEDYLATLFVGSFISFCK